VATASNKNLTIWLRYDEPHGVTTQAQTAIDLATGNTPRGESLNVSVGPLDAVDVAATDLATTIRAVSGGRATLAAAAASTVRCGECRFGTDDHRAFQSALDAGARGPVSIAWPWGVPSNGNGRVEIPPGHAYYIGSPLIYSGSNLELSGSGATIYYGGRGTFLRLGAALTAGTCAKSNLTAFYDIHGVRVIGTFNASAGIALPCAGQAWIDRSLIQGFIENLDVGAAGTSGTSPDTKITRTFLDRGIINMWVHTADLFTFSDGGYYGYRDRGMVLCGDDNPDTLRHSMKIDSAEGAAHLLSSAAGLDVGNLDGFELRNVYDEPGVVRGVPEGAGPALRFGYIGSPHGGLVTGGTWSGNKVDSAVQFDEPGSAGVKSDVVFYGNYLVNWGVGFDLSTAQHVFAGPNRFEPQTITGARYIGVDSSDSIIDGGLLGGMGTVMGLASTVGAGPFFSFTTVYSAAVKPIPDCTASRLHWRACVSDAPGCVSGRNYAAGGRLAPCELWCNGQDWIESGSGC
jgi:hypothetical protein